MSIRWFVIGALLFAAGCTTAESQAAKNGGQSSRSVSVKSATVARISIQRTVELAGNLVSPDQARVSCEVAGVVQSVAVRLGQEVSEGEALVRLDPRELEFALQRAESALRQTEAQLGIAGDNGAAPADEQVSAVRTALANRDDARAQNARAEQLTTRGLLATVDLEATRTHLKVAEAAYESAIEMTRSLKASLQDRRAAYALAQKKLKDAVIRAPVSGSISERLVQPGEFIKEDTPVVTIVKMDPLQLNTAVQEKFAGIILAGMPLEFSVESFPKETFHGRIVSVSPAVDQQTRTFPIEAELPNPGRRLKPGFFAKGVILTRTDENVLAVPEDAVSTLAGVSTVYVIDGGKIRAQLITPGVHQGKLIEVAEGLTGNERLATSNLNQLTAGVSVTSDDKGAAAPAGDRAAGSSDSTR